MIIFNNCKGEWNWGFEYSFKFSRYSQVKNTVRVGAGAVIINLCEDGKYEQRIIKITKLGRKTTDCGILCVTVDGDLYKSTIMTKDELIIDKFSSDAFDKLGRFKQQSII